jgi:hypothetical protein
MQSYSGQITPSKETALKTIVDSVVFDTAPRTKETDLSPTNAFTYTDLKTQTSFTVPANWTETPLSEEREFIDVKFTSLEEDGMTILYGSSDIWSEMTASERSGYSRSDIDNSIFSKTEIAEILELSSDNIRLVTYGGNEYYTATVASSMDAYGPGFTVTITHAFLVNNGYMYWFQFSGASDNEFYKDFVSLLSDAKIADLGRESVLGNSNDLTSWFSLVDILLSLLVTIIVYSLPIIIYRYAVRKAPVGTKKAKKITIIYGVLALLAVSVIIFAINGNIAIGGAILFWSYVNYRVLIRGTSKDHIEEDAIEIEPSNQSVAFTESQTQRKEESSQNTDSEALDGDDEQAGNTSAPIYFVKNMPAPKKEHCHKCGALLPKDSIFCHRCGTKAYVEEEGK